MKRMTLNELRAYVQEQAMNLYEQWDFEDYQARVREARSKTPMESVLEFFHHFKIDTTNLNQDILRTIFMMWDEESDYEGLSDMQDNEDGSVSIELDGMFGKHWMKFKDHEEWRKYYEDVILADARREFERLYKKYDMQLKAKEAEKERIKANTNTLGNSLSPEMLNKLKDIK